MYNLGKKEIVMCEMLGYGLARTCIEGNENNREFYKITSILTPDKRDGLLREVIYYKISFADIKMWTILPKERYDIVRNSFINSIVDTWTRGSKQSLFDKIDSYTESFEEVFPNLMVNSGVSPLDIPANKFENFMTNFLEWLAEDIKELRETIERMSDVAITNYEHWNKENQKIVDNILSDNKNNSGCLGSVFVFAFVICFLIHLI